MNTAQKCIKYLAFGLAGAILLGLVGGLLQMSLQWIDFPQKEKLEEPASWSFNQGVSALELDIAGLEVQIQEGATFTVETDSPYVSCTERNGTVIIREKKNAFFGKSHGGLLKICLPSDLIFKRVDLDAGAGLFEVELLKAERLELDLGAGKVNLQGLEITKEASIDGGAGHITVGRSVLTNLDMDLGVGDLELTAEVLGKSEIDCGVGKVSLVLLPAEDYKIQLDKGVGSATLNGSFVKNHTLYGDGPNFIEISGGVGNIEIDLAETDVIDE